MPTQFIEIITDEMLSRAKNSEVMVVDIRPIAAFNGWKLQKEKRGGHIHGASCFPFEWTRYEFELQELFLEKGMVPDRSISLYGYSGKETKDMAKLLLDAGYKDVSVYNRFQEEWSADMDLPLDHLENYQSLVYPEWVMKLIHGKNPPGYLNNKCVICHSHYGNREDYETGHIPGAIDLDTLGLESPDTWNCRSPEELNKTLVDHGVAHVTTVILYWRFSFPDMGDPFPGKSAGHLGAIRNAFIMLYAGVKDVRLLNGGISSWELAGYEISRRESNPIPVSDFGAIIAERTELIVDIPEAKELLASEDGELVCVRSWPRVSVFDGGWFEWSNDPDKPIETGIPET